LFVSKEPNKRFVFQFTYRYPDFCPTVFLLRPTWDAEVLLAFFGTCLCASRRRSDLQKHRTLAVPYSPGVSE